MVDELSCFAITLKWSQDFLQSSSSFLNVSCWESKSIYQRKEKISNDLKGNSSQNTSGVDMKDLTFESYNFKQVKKNKKQVLPWSRDGQHPVRCTDPCFPETYPWQLYRGGRARTACGRCLSLRELWQGSRAEILYSIKKRCNHIHEKPRCISLLSVTLSTKFQNAYHAFVKKRNAQDLPLFHWESFRRIKVFLKYIWTWDCVVLRRRLLLNPSVVQQHPVQRGKNCEQNTLTTLYIIEMHRYRYRHIGYRP